MTNMTHLSPITMDPFIVLRKIRLFVVITKIIETQSKSIDLDLAINYLRALGCFSDWNYYSYWISDLISDGNYFGIDEMLICH